MMVLSVMMDINLEYNTVGGHVKRGGSLPNLIQNSRENFKINGGNVTSRRGSRRRDGASIVATSLQCRSHGIGPLDRRWRRRVCQSEPRLLTRRSTPSLVGDWELTSWGSGEADVDDGRVEGELWTLCELTISTVIFPGGRSHIQLYRLPWSISVPTLVLIAQAIYLLQHGHRRTIKHKCIPYPSPWPISLLLYLFIFSTCTQPNPTPKVAIGHQLAGGANYAMWSGRVWNGNMHPGSGLPRVTSYSNAWSWVKIKRLTTHNRRFAVS